MPPPEQRGYAYRYGQPGAKSDIFAFGMTMYRLWTGKNPHPFLERNLPDISALRDLLCDCVAENPAQRPESTYLVKSLTLVTDEQAATLVTDEQVAAKHPATDKLLENQLVQKPVQPQVENEPAQMKNIQQTDAEREQDKEAWQQACQENTVEAYQAYLNNNDAPKKYAKTAQYRIQVIENGADERAWDKAYQENTVEAYQAYLEGDTLKKQADEAKKQIQVLDEKAWQQACEENTVAAYQAYLDGNTLKQYADDAQKYADKKAWQQAGEENTVAAYQAYLDGNTWKNYVDGAQKHLEEAEKRLEDIEAWQWTCQQDTKAAYQAYLDGDTLKNYAVYAKKLLQGYRYTDNGDGTIADNRTGLIWLKNANCFGEQNWEAAMQSVAKLADGQCGLSDGSKAGDWRLPTKDEWEAMVDNKYENPALSNATGTSQWTEGDAFSGVQADYYWSSTTDAGNASSAWDVSLNNGDVDSNDKTSSSYVWPVRGGIL